MKKNFFLSMLMLVALCMMAGACHSCTSCGKGEPGSSAVGNEMAAADYDGAAIDFTASVARIQSLHRQSPARMN